MLMILDESPAAPPSIGLRKLRASTKPEGRVDEFDDDWLSWPSRSAACWDRSRVDGGGGVLLNGLSSLWADVLVEKGWREKKSVVIVVAVQAFSRARPRRPRAALAACRCMVGCCAGDTGWVDDDEDGDVPGGMVTLLGAKSWSLDVQVEIVLRALIGQVGILKWVCPEDMHQWGLCLYWMF